MEEDDRFCGACGHDLSAAAAPPGPDRPTLAIPVPPEWRAPGAPGAGAGAGTAGRPPSGEPPRSLGEPGAAGQPGAAEGYAPGVGEAYGPGVAGQHGPGGGYGPGGAPGETGDFALPAPQPPAQTPAPAPQPPAADPRVAAVPAPPAPAAPSAGKVCVACRSGRVDPDGYCENCGHAQPKERDHMERELGPVAAVSDRGLRHHRNEDAFAISTTALPDGSPAVVAIVCDGVSSATRPDEASLAAAGAANELLLAALPRGTHPQQAMREAIVAAAAAVDALADRTPAADPAEPAPHHQLNAPACTIVGAISAGGLLIVGWVGDSRVYWVPDDRGGPAARLTEDDSWAAQMVAAGLMNEREAYADERAHAITGWLGADAYELEPHTAAFKPDRPGVVVVCTDGLWNYAEGPDEMARAIPADAAERPLHSAQVLVGHALDGGGHDNVTVAVLPFAVARQGAESSHGAYHRA
ncbi:PP2C family protein-serine/threonine phosphatase [Streptomyces sp. NPDC020141]|uniref:PP2C family protein-serine/threonine phosphatase n=1 Tax=Streptomyces sp. NPDC020141 TaxID=3365065 RepID=UPI0037A16A08